MGDQCKVRKRRVGRRLRQEMNGELPQGCSIAGRAAALQAAIAVALVSALTHGRSGVGQCQDQLGLWAQTQTGKPQTAAAINRRAGRNAFRLGSTAC